ncbi:MAG: hypothetical protein JNK14_14550 [Chitinophagaceae bacterium]|nr:hypothetical protein [Chitinophagaceae bacterium]
MKIKEGKVILSNGKNITRHTGYDNQPFFHPSKPVIYYSSFNDSDRSDIKYFDYKKNTTANLTLTREREYSPVVTPDGKFISCIIQRDNGAQDLGKYPIHGGEPTVLISDLVVGYHAWADKNRLLLFVLADSNRHTLRDYYLLAKRDTVLAMNIGRSLHKIPGVETMSFVQKVNDKEFAVKKYDLSTGAITDIAIIQGTDHLTWLNNGLILTSSGAQLFSYRADTDSNWQPVVIEGDRAMLKGITRLAANTKNDKLAVVVSE